MLWPAGYFKYDGMAGCYNQNSLALEWKTVRIFRVVNEMALCDWQKASRFMTVLFICVE